jgi:hypothetical protein
VNHFNKPLLIIFALAAAIRLPFVFLTPLWQAPDEYPHFHYIRALVETAQIPISRPQFPDYEAYQPPLYYLIGAGIFQLTSWPGVPAVPEDVSRLDPSLPLVVLALRLFSLILGVGVVYLAFVVGRKVFPNNPFLSLALPLMLALHPTFVSNTTSITNDALANFLGALLVLILLPPLERANTTLVGFGLGAALLTKYNLLPFAVLAVFVLWQGRPSTGLWWRQILSIAAVALLLSGWFFLFNYSRYDHPLAVRPGVETEFAPLSGAWDWQRWLQVIRNYNWSFWCAFGRIYEIHFPAWFYLGFFGPLSFVIIFGAVRAAWSGLIAERKREFSKTPNSIYKKSFPDIKVTRFFLLGLLLYVGAAFGFTASLPIECAWGKYVFPFLMPIWILILCSLNAAIGQKFLKVLIVFLAAGFIFMNMTMLWRLARLQ